MIQPFYGEFLVQPFPLHLGMNYCTHKCAYCFANLNRPGRRADVSGIVAQVNAIGRSENLVSRLLSEGYPVLIANNSDPFAQGNRHLTLPLLNLLKARKIPVSLQTKGGKGIDEALALIAPSYWYISIPFLTDDHAKRIEPGAPPVSARWDLVRKLRDLGHAVCVAANPLDPEWIPDLGAWLDHAERAGAQGVWAENLHLNNNQTRNMTPKELAAVGPGVIQRAFKGGRADASMAHFAELSTLCPERGMPFYSVGNPFPSDYWKPAQALYPKLFPIMQDAINGFFFQAVEAMETDACFRDFRSHLSGVFPSGNARVMDYLGATSPKLKAVYPQAAELTYEGFLQLVWQSQRMNLCPANLLCFAPDPVGADVDGLPVWRYSAELFDG